MALVRLEFVEGCIEHSTAVPGRGKASQTDLLVVAKSPDGIATVAVVGKVDEGFDKTVWEWGTHTSRNRSTRISGLCDWLNLSVSDVSKIKYQLIHRTASALIEADKIKAKVA